MATNHKKADKKHSKNVIDLGILSVNFAIYLLVIYFIYHALNGERGLFAYKWLSTELTSKRATLQQLDEEKALLNQKLSLISTKIDTDLIDELARKKLGLAGKDETMIILKD